MMQGVRVAVQEICRDIRKLDTAKGHLTATITALRRLAMLVAAVGKGAELPACQDFGLLPDSLTQAADLGVGCLDNRAAVSVTRQAVCAQ